MIAVEDPAELGPNGGTADVSGLVIGVECRSSRAGVLDLGASYLAKMAARFARRTAATSSIGGGEVGISISKSGSGALGGGGSWDKTFGGR